MKSMTEKARFKHKVLLKIGKMRSKGEKHAVCRAAGYFQIADIKKIYKWEKRWDGRWQSLIEGNHRPKSHPKQHSEAEIALMVAVRREVGFIAPLLFYQELCERGYSRSYGGMKQFMRKHFGATRAPEQDKNKGKVYHGGKFPGDINSTKSNFLQLDVKYVPSESIKCGVKMYQFTAVDECSRWTYREIFDEHSTYSAHQFLLNLVRVSPFPIRLVQTEKGIEGNGVPYGFLMGTEWTNALLVVKSPHKTLFEDALIELGIDYTRIRIATPRHNGRVERQHGLDGIRFYSKNKFYSLADARLKLAKYNDWSNSRIKTCLNFKSPIQIVDDYMCLIC